MLPANLLRYEIDNNEIHVAYVDSESESHQATASDLIELYTAHIGRSKGELTNALADYEDDDTDYHLIRGLAKLLEDLSDFAIHSPIEPEVLREKIFADSSKRHPVVIEPNLLHQHTRSTVLTEIANEFGISADDVSRGMYADLDENRVLMKFDPLTPQWLLDRYNVALAQAVLYRASKMTLRIYPDIPTKYKQIFKFIKFFKLMHVINGNHADGYQITLDGPVSMFRLSQKYGIRMALFLPALLQCDRWWMDAKVIMRGDAYYHFKLTDACELRSHYQQPSEFDSKLEQRFAEQFKKLDTAWEFERETEIIDFKETVFIPDFSFLHPDGRRALMEIVGFWTPDYLRRKLWKLRQAKRDNIIIAVSDRLNCTKEDFRDIHGELVFFKTRIDSKVVLDRVEACALVE